MRLRITGIGNPSINLQGSGVLQLCNVSDAYRPRRAALIARCRMGCDRLVPMSAYRPTVSRNLRCSPLSPTLLQTTSRVWIKQCNSGFDPITITQSHARWPTALFTLAKPWHSNHYRSYRYRSQMLHCGSGLSGALPTVLARLTSSRHLIVPLAGSRNDNPTRTLYIIHTMFSLFKVLRSMV